MPYRCFLHPKMEEVGCLDRSNYGSQTSFNLSGRVHPGGNDSLQYVTGLGLLFQGSMLFVALIVFLLVQAYLAAAPFPVTDVAVIFTKGLVCFIPLGLYIRGVVKAQDQSFKIGEKHENS